MRVLGLIGGTTWPSTALYYRRLNEIAHEALGGAANCPCILFSVDFAAVDANVKAGRQDLNEAIFVDAAERLKLAGAQALVICANTPHMFAPGILKAADLPLIHIGEATAQAVRRAGLRKVGLLGTRFVMEMDFLKGILHREGIEVLIPESDADREYVHRSIFDEFSSGRFLPETRREYLRIIADLRLEGAEGVILGCTEIPMLLGDSDAGLPTFDTTEIHVQAAASFALQSGDLD